MEIVGFAVALVVVLVIGAIGLRRQPIVWRRRRDPGRGDPGASER
jgi:hypothetical protein